jgi:hypothetical protein
MAAGVSATAGRGAGTYAAGDTADLAAKCSGYCTTFINMAPAIAPAKTNKTTLTALIP